MSGYRGRHRAPSTAGRTAVRLAAVGVAVTAPVTLAQPAEAAVRMPANVRAAIISCESGGDAKAQNRTSTASGLYQFTNGTWRAFGGGEFAPTAAQATPAQQDRVADRAFAANGTRDWEADPRSEACWRPKLARAGAERAAAARTELPQVKPPPVRHRASQARMPAVYTVESGDTLSKIAARDGRGGVTVSSLVRANGIDNPDFIVVGQKLTIA